MLSLSWLRRTLAAAFGTWRECAAARCTQKQVMQRVVRRCAGGVCKSVVCIAVLRGIDVLILVIVPPTNCCTCCDTMWPVCGTPAPLAHLVAKA
jgi:hypothetical protein